MSQEEYEAAIATFIGSRGVTQCPTACAVPTQGVVAAADRAALGNYAAACDRSRRQKAAARQRLFGRLKARGGSR